MLREIVEPILINEWAIPEWESLIIGGLIIIVLTIIGWKPLLWIANLIRKYLDIK